MAAIVPRDLTESSRFAVDGRGGRLGDWDARSRRMVGGSFQLCELGGASAGGSSAAPGAGDRGRGAGGSVAGSRAAVFAAGASLDRAGEAAAGAVVASLLFGPLGTPADGAARL